MIYLNLRNHNLLKLMQQIKLIFIFITLWVKWYHFACNFKKFYYSWINLRIWLLFEFFHIFYSWQNKIFINWTEDFQSSIKFSCLWFKVQFSYIKYFQTLALIIKKWTFFTLEFNWCMIFQINQTKQFHQVFYNEYFMLQDNMISMIFLVLSMMIFV
jgi:hypothetical protein